MVSDLVRDHVGLREVAGGTEAALQLVVEREVDVDLVVGGAVERPDRGLCEEAAARVDAAREQDEARLLVGCGRGRHEGLVPDVLGVGEHDRHELPLLAVVRGLLVGLLVVLLRLRGRSAALLLRRDLSQQIERGFCPVSHASRRTTTRPVPPIPTMPPPPRPPCAVAHVIDVVALSAAAPLHALTLSRSAAGATAPSGFGVGMIVSGMSGPGPRRPPPSRSPARSRW